MRRLVSVDVLRGVAIVMMLLAHLWALFILPGPDLATRLQVGVVAIFAGYAAPLFTMVSGLGACLATRAALEQGRGLAADESHRFLARGAALFGLSLGFNLLIGPLLHLSDAPLLNWSVIQLIGACYALVPLFVRLHPAGQVLWLLATLLLPALPMAREGLTAPLFHGFAPLFPWSALFFAAMVAGRGLLAGASRSPARALRVAAGRGLSLLAVGWLLGVVGRPFSWAHMEQMSASTATIFMAILVLALGSARFLLDRKEHHGWLVRSLIGMGQLALSIYYVHLFAFVVAAAVAARLLGESLRLHAGWFPLLALATFLLVDGTINRLWARWGHRWSVEWWVARLVAGPTKGSTAPTTFAAESPLSRH